MRPVADELRHYVDHSLMLPSRAARLLEIAGRIDEEHFREVEELRVDVSMYRTLWEAACELTDWVPLDADGVPCLMDETVLLDGEPCTIVAMSHKGKLALRETKSKAPRWVPSKYVRHEEK